jgi:hypothetical protein
MNEWNNISGLVQGDISYSLRISNFTDRYFDFIINGYSERWKYFDIKIQYRFNKNSNWSDDIQIIAANAKYVNGNKIYGLKCSKYGTESTIRWKYIDNLISYGMKPEIKIIILPRIRNYSTSGSFHIVSEVYAKNRIETLAYSIDDKAININNKGQYICKNSNSIYIKDQLGNKKSIIYGRSGIDEPLFAKQLYSDNYIVTTSNAIYEFDETFENIIKTYSTIKNVKYCDYSETNDTLLLTKNNQIIEIIWSDYDFGQVVFESDFIINNASSSVYYKNQEDKILISDDNRILIYDRTERKLKELNSVYLYNNDIIIPKSLPSALNKPLDNIFRSFEANEELYLINDGIEELGLEESSSSESSVSISESSSQSEEGIEIWIVEDTFVVT